MLIRKKFNVESAHIVRNCTSERCSHSIHGHSATIELFLIGRKLDNAGMLYDFGLLKGTVKEFIDSMDHCYLLCANDKPEFVKFIKENCDRWIELPFNPSAECLSMFCHSFIDYILKNTIASNGEGYIEVNKVRYHETSSGWAESSNWDMENIWNPDWFYQVEFSKGVTKDWSNDLKNIIFNGETTINPTVKQQIKLD